MSDKMTA